MTTKQRTITEAKALHPLASAVLRQLGGGQEAIETAIEAGNHGADAGWCGFTYYKDTCAFTKAHRRAIAQAVEDMANELGEDPITMVKGFRILDRDTMPTSAIAKGLYGGRASSKDEEDCIDLVENALAWFALEEVGRALAND